MFKRFGLAAVLALASVFVALPAPGAHAGGLFIIVDTTEDLPGTSGNCSLREAITASNANAHVDQCQGLGFDGIGFSLGGSGTPVIQIGATPLPNITDPVSIDGGLDRVEIRGPGGSPVVDHNGLTIMSSAPNTRISHLVIDKSQASGIRVDADNVTLTGNYIGTDASGTQVAGNLSDQVHVTGKSISIGGDQGTMPGGGCTGDCNLIAVTGGGFSSGIHLEGSAANAGIVGNFIGSLEVTGNSSIGTVGAVGIRTFASGTLIGGFTPERRNVISGSGTNVGISGELAGVYGNYIGTNSAGTAALPGNGAGVLVASATDASISGNVISGHGESDGVGIYLTSATSAAVYGNLIGTAADGTTPLPNGSHGIFLDRTNGSIIGDPAQGFGNTIAYNGGDGVHVDGSNGTTVANPIRGNSIHDNGMLGIEDILGGNNGIGTPIVTSAHSNGASGTSCVGCTIDIFSDDANEGKVFHGFVQADLSGNWTFSGSLTGPNITATQTDTDNNTSGFSPPLELPVPTPTPSPTPSPTPTPIPTPTPTPTGPVPIQGDADCDGDVDLDDVVVELADIADTPGGEQCRAAQATGAGGHTRDVNCDGDITPLDALDILLEFAGLPELPLPSNCPAVGDPIV